MSTVPHRARAAQVGRPMDRADGRAKVTGAARYSAEYAPPGTVYAVLVGARIAAGEVTGIDARRALRSDGVLAVLSHLNLPPLAAEPHLLPSLAGAAASGQSFFPMRDARVHYAGQPVAMVVADTLERAGHAAELLEVSYRAEPHVTGLEQGREHAYEPERIFAGFLPGRIGRGDVDRGLAEADTVVETVHRLAANHHNPIEPAAATAQWQDGRLTVHDSTQGPTATRLTVAELLGLPPSQVRVLAPAVGGSFGSKAMVWSHPVLAAMAARHVRAPVKLAVTREQMFTACGHREEQEHRFTLGARRDGTLTAMRHHKLSPTSPFDDWTEPSLEMPARMYACPNHEGVYRLFRANTMTPAFMRAPGEASGMFVLETAMDELAGELGMDPVELRLRNHCDDDPSTGLPWSSKGLRECYARGAEMFGWHDRAPVPGTRTDGHWLVGTGMASAVYPVYQAMGPQRARVRLYADGRATAETACADFGTGVGAVMRQVAAAALGIGAEQVEARYGDTELPTTVAAVGSAGTGAIASAVHTAASALREQMVARAVADPASPLYGTDPGRVEAAGGRMFPQGGSGGGEAYTDVLRRHMMSDAEALGAWDPPGADGGYAAATFGAQFAEVGVDPDLGLVRVRRMLGVFAPGRVLNAKTARSQLMGGMLWGVGHALLEATRMDPGSGRWANASMGDYLLPVNADAPEVRVEFAEVEDAVVNPLGAKGVGEVGVVGASAAIANAVHHATGRRFRDLPITIEAVLGRGQGASA
ncbi:xanthine dehydrogenase family protein molybdopterin-binding subunit [Nocardiopsis halophila]|uniref:xanthine dehydrogenase family protein molybdopterin-binding subunit n=1 Tax=Nocardiopsis halophila TaxID=141692 RepID=UPI00036066A7|nr:xanthine dehydrogenase family protein molybdopterin-binding subunit [Nocardiopsis halophila]